MQKQKNIKMWPSNILSWIINFISSRTFLYITFAWFIAQAVWMALSTNLDIAPDEAYHYSLIQLFAKNGWLPIIHNQQGYYSLGEVKHTPFILYHYLLSIPFHLFANSPHTVQILRFINIGLGAVSFYLLNRLAVKLKVPQLVKNLSLFMLANTLMFVFLVGSINYDNLLMALSFGCFLLYFSIIEEFKLTYLLLLFIGLLAGSLTAINFLPIGLAIVMALLWKLHRNQSIRTNTSLDLKRNRLKVLALLVPILLLLALFSQRYLVNIVTYHTYTPACERVNTIPQCMQSGIYQRSADLKSNGNRVDITPMEYFGSLWIWNMTDGTFGILGQKSILPNKAIRYWSEILCIAGTLLLFRYYKRDKVLDFLLLIFVFYSTILFLQDYLGYKHVGVNLGVQGRYEFIFLPVLYFLASYYILKDLRPKTLQLIYIVLTVIIFATASLPTYIYKTTTDWHTPRTIKINSGIKESLRKII